MTRIGLALKVATDLRHESRTAGGGVHLRTPDFERAPKAPAVVNNGDTDRGELFCERVLMIIYRLAETC